MPFPVFVFISIAIAAGTAGGTMLYSRQRWMAVSVAVAGAIGLLLFHGPGYFHYYADDAYITLRYSRHLADGLGPNWNSVGHVEGYTSFLWMLINAGAGVIGIDIKRASEVLGFLSMAGAFAAVVFIWQLWSDDEPDSGIGRPIVLATVLLGLALTDAIPFWGFSGMETPFFMAMLTVGVWSYLRERRRGGFPFSALWFLAAAMTRPEGIVAAGVTGLFVAADAARVSDRRRALQRVALWGVLFAIPFVIFYAWRWSYYGYLFPNTYYAKVGNTLAIYNRGLEYVSNYGLRYHVLLMLVGLGFLYTRLRLRTDAVYIFALSTAMMLAIVIEGGDDFPNGRFMAPLLPILLLGGIAGFAVALRRLALDPLRAGLLASVTLTLGGLALLPTSYNGALERERQAHHERTALGRWLNENTPEDYTIAAFAVGAIAYYADDRDILDLLGLNDETIGHTDVPDLGEGIAGHEKYNPDYVFDTVGPEVLVANDAEPGPLTTEELREAVKRPSRPPRDLILNDSRLWERYEVRSLNLDGRWFNILVRKDVIEQLQLPAPP
jgi:hypothetical protein